jgi:hypothetical protein
MIYKEPIVREPTNSVEQSPSREAKSSSILQEILRT